MSGWLHHIADGPANTQTKRVSKKIQKSMASHSDRLEQCTGFGVDILRAVDTSDPGGMVTS